MELNIYRYTFEIEFAKELYIFAKIHQYDNRHDFKDSWKEWMNDNDEIIQLEVDRLLKLEYKGDILDKMFKSARYYFRKKKIVKKEPIIRREYIGIEKSLLYAMTEHIIKNIINKNYKPSDGFFEFCKLNIELLTKEVKRLYMEGIQNSNEIQLKIKKTYKNRYFTISKNIKNLETNKPESITKKINIQSPVITSVTKKIFTSQQSILAIIKKKSCVNKQNK